MMHLRARGSTCPLLPILKVHPALLNDRALVSAMVFFFVLLPHSLPRLIYYFLFSPLPFVSSFPWLPG